MRFLTLWRKLFSYSLITLCLIGTNIARSDNVDTSNLQAAYVYNFMVFAKWQNVAKTERLLCIAGQNRESLALKNLAGKEVNGAHIVVNNINTDAELTQCDVLFVANTEFSHLLDSALGKNILVLTNIQPDNGRVAAIILSSVGNRVVFDLDMATLTQSGVHLAASVLRLARSSKE